MNLSVIYHSGEGVERDDKEAVKWWRKAAEHGFAKVQASLGVMYHYGQGDRSGFRRGPQRENQGIAEGYLERVFLGL